MLPHRPLVDLPPPPPEAVLQSERLTDHIRQAMAKQGGAIPFAHFMALALYAPGLGYYSAGSRKFGAEGDFITAPEISPLFARCLARNCAVVLKELPGADLLEVGAGSGVMAADLLRTLADRATLPEHYYILELSADLRLRQQTLLANTVPDFFARIVWLDELPEQFRGVVVANELIDAMPVHRFCMAERGIFESFVVWQADSGFELSDRLCDHQPLLERLHEMKTELGDGYLVPGYYSEINLAADSWVRTLAERLTAGAIVLIDYGYPRAEYYHPERRRGTLMCHYRHYAHSDPLIFPGIQDITAHVDFTALAEAGVAAGCELLGYTTQAHFLLSSGLEEEMARVDISTPQAHAQRAQQVQKLTMPGEMGELFKVMALGKNIEAVLPGFTLRDQRGRL